jgi:aspartate carbamoyltransferase regulatory subunit
MTAEGTTRTFISPKEVLYSISNTQVFRYQHKAEQNPPFLVFCDNLYRCINHKATGVIYFEGEWHHINYIPNTQEFEIGPVYVDIAQFNTNPNLISSKKLEEISAILPKLSINEEIRNKPILEKLQISPLTMVTTTIAST